MRRLLLVLIPLGTLLLGATPSPWQVSPRTTLPTTLPTSLPTSTGAHGGPSVWLVLCDDCGTELFDSYMQPDGQTTTTPELDTLSAAGARFTDAHVWPLCGPGKGEILTGMFANQSGAMPGGGGGTNGAQDSLDNVHFPEQLYRFGVTTVGFGKFGQFCYEAWLGTDCGAIADSHIYDYGFTYFLGTEGQVIVGSNYWNHTPVESILSPPSEANVSAVTDHHTTWVTGQATDWWTDSRLGRQAFVWLHFHTVHTPLNNYATGDETTQCPESDSVCYLAQVENFANQMGTILSTIDLTKDYLIVMGDNGSVQDTYTLQDPDTCGGYSKGTMSDCGTKVPLWIAGPDITAGKVYDDLVSAIDLYPTILDMMNIPEPTVNDVGAAMQLQGISLLPRITGAAGVDSRQTLLTGGDSDGANNEATIWWAGTNWELLWQESDPDPYQPYFRPDWINLASGDVADYVEERLKTQMLAWFNDRRSWCSEDARDCEDFEATIATDCVTDTTVDAVTLTPVCDNSSGQLSGSQDLLIDDANEYAAWYTIGSSTTGAGCTATGTCEADFLLNLTALPSSGSTDVMAFWTNGAGADVCAIQIGTTADSWRVNARGTAATASSTGSLSAGTTYKVRLTYNGTDTATDADTCIATLDLESGTYGDGAVGSSSEVANTTGSVIDELWAGSTKDLDQHVDEVVIRSYEPTPYAGDFSCQREGLGWGYCETFDEVQTPTDCERLGLLGYGSPDNPADCSVSGIDGDYALSVDADQGGTQWWYVDGTGCSGTTDEVCEARALIKITTLPAIKTNNFFELYTGDVGAGGVVCGVDLNDSGQLFLKALNNAGSDAIGSAGDIVAGTTYKFCLHADTELDRCRLWVDPSDGAWCGGEIVSGYNDGSAFTVSDELWLGSGDTTMDVTFDNVHTREIPSSPVP